MKRYLMQIPFLHRTNSYGCNSLASFSVAVIFFLLRFSRGKPDPKKAMIFPTNSPGNLGDEAVLTAFTQIMTAKGLSVNVVSVSRNHLWDIRGASTKGFNLNNSCSFVELYAFLKFLSSFAHFYIWGADVMDGVYGLSVSRVRYLLANCSARMGIETKIFGASFRKEIPPEIVSDLKKLEPRVTLTCRGEISRKRLKKYGITRPVEVYPDLAFSLQAENTIEDEELHNWLKEKAAQGKILGVNLNNHLISKKFGNYRLSELVALYYEILERVLIEEPDLSIVLMPHLFTEVNTNIDDYDLCKCLYDQLQFMFFGKVYCLYPALRATQLRKILEYVDVVFTGKMHLSIAALAVGKFPVSVSYLDKFNEIYDQVGLDRKYIISTSYLENVDFVSSLLRDSLRKADAVINEILFSIQEKVEMSLKHLESDLIPV